MSQTVKLSVILVVVFAALSFIAKFQNRNHGIHYFDNQYIFQLKSAVELVNELPVNQLTYCEIYKQCLKSEPLVYPLGLTLMYVNVLKWSQKIYDQSFEYMQWIKSLRVLHILFFPVLILLVMMFPIEFNLKLLSIFLLSISLVLHQYSSQLSVHVAGGTANFLTLLFVLRGIDSTKIKRWFFLSSVMAGIATGIIYTGATGFFSIVLAMILLKLKNKINWGQYFLYQATSVMIWFVIFLALHPNMLRIFIESNALFVGATYSQDDHLGSLFGVRGFKSYLNDIFGVEPVIWFFYLLGLYYLFKNRFWKNQKWLIIVSSTLFYQIVTGCLVYYAVRHASFIIPLMTLVASYGISVLLRDRKRVAMILLVFMFAFSILNIGRYNYLIAHDSRELVYQYVRNVVPEDEKIIIDMGLPVFLRNNKGHIDRRYQVELLDSLPSMIEYLHHVKGMALPGVDELLKKGHSLQDIVKRDENFPVFMRSLGFDYYVTSYNWSGEFSGEFILRESNVMKSWKNSFGDSKNRLVSWPPKGDSFYIWKMWSMDYGGPDITVCKLKRTE